MRFLAIDHGDKRTGLAVCDADETLAGPHSVIETQNQPYLAQSIAEIIQKESIEGVVLGLPLNMDDSEGPRVKRVRAFAKTLSRLTDVPIHFHDERLSSYMAESLFSGLALTRKDKKKRLDAVAAAAILQSFLEHRKSSFPRHCPKIVRTADPEALADRAAAEFAAAAHEAVFQRGVFYAAISGGRTPRLFFERLARPDLGEQIPWDKTRLFWADERCVPPDSPESNYALAVETFLSLVPIPPEQVYRVRGEYEDCQRAADAYEAVLRDVFDLHDKALPCFDLIVLGLGTDGHIASLLPGDIGVSITDHLTWPVYHETRFNRVTLTAPVLTGARKLLVLVSGQDKAAIARSLFSSPPDTDRYPAYVLWPAMDNILWLMDAAAASRL